VTDDARDPEHVKKLQQELEELQETLRAIRDGEVDAVVVEGPKGVQVFTHTTAERPYRRLVEQMQDGAVTLTHAGDILYCNPRFGELVGAPCERIVGGSIDRFIVASDRPRLAASMRAGRGTYEGHLLAADGDEVPIYLSVGPFVSDGVESLCVVVTDRSKLLRTRAARDEAEAASQAQDEFIAMLGHEVRNPLGAISAAIAVLDRIDPATERASRARAVIARQTEHLSRLIEDLLEVTRGVLGKIVLVRTEVDVADAVRRCIATLHGMNKLAGRVVTVEAESAWVEADAARLEQIVMNLLSNAVKFTASGGAIRVTVHRADDEAVLQVADDGVGIASEFLPSVFDLFAQGSRSLDRPGGGLGVGLTLARRLVELHGGRIDAVSSGPGRGSTLTVRLPALARSRREGGLSPDTPVAPATTTKRRILVVEDNADNREMMRILLETSGHEVHEAPDGPSGVDLAIRLEPEIALVDIGLPGLDGYEVARQIRAKLHQRVKLIALSGYGRREDRQRAFAAGFDDHLIKPVDPEHLAAALDRPS
jgi:PAS domain S-box-containing protein